MTFGVTIGALLIAGLVAGTMLARRAGYPLGGNVVVRCRRGHLFTTIWVPGASLKAVRLGWLRFQHCPVGNHWSLCAPVKDSDLSDAERQAAQGRHDVLV